MAWVYGFLSACGVIVMLRITKQGFQAVLEDEDEEGGGSGYSAAYARLHNAAFTDPDPFPSVQDTSKYLAESIGRFSQVGPDIIPPLHLEPVLVLLLVTSRSQKDLCCSVLYEAC